MTTIALNSLETNPFGRTICSLFPDLEKGNYALIPANNGRTKLMKQTKSEGTDFYKDYKHVNFPFEKIVASRLLPSYPIELNASPAGSDCQEYESALVFHV